MSEEPATIRPQSGQALRDAAREDLELYGVEELQERIAALEAEIAAPGLRSSARRPRVRRPMRCSISSRTRKGAFAAN